MVGTEDDMNQQTRSERHDDSVHQTRVKTVRDLIYKQNAAVKSKKVEAQLFQESLTATMVRAPITASILSGLSCETECLFGTTVTLGI